MSAFKPSAPGGASADDERLLSVLGRYISRITARGLIENARREPDVASHAGTEAGHAKLSQKLAHGVRLFTDEATHKQVLYELLALRGAAFGAERPAASPLAGTALASGPGPALGPGTATAAGAGQAPRKAEAPAVAGGQMVRVEIRREADLATARTAARDLCLRLSVRPMVLQKVATIVSELARNMVSYAGGGLLQISVQSSPTRAFVIRSTDSGPGIANIDEILAGRYQSKTGLGLGILGTKRLAAGFKIETSPKGTQIEAEVAF